VTRAVKSKVTTLRLASLAALAGIIFGPKIQYILEVVTAAFNPAVG